LQIRGLRREAPVASGSAIIAFMKSEERDRVELRLAAILAADVAN
jgi:hypothetical protein